MEYSESLEQASEFAKSALSIMGKKGVVCNPNNFTIWFYYFSGKYPDLTRTLDILLDNGQDITEAINVDLFEKFFTFSSEGAILDDATEKIEGELKSILKYLDKAGGNAAEYSKTLVSVSGEISAKDTAADIKSIVAKALSATKEMEKHNKSLEDKFNASSMEVFQLKEDLDNMRQEAMTDGLTGIANRKMFDSELRRTAMEAMEKGTELCLLILDIDHFKKFNDTYGHQVGDQVLKLLAATLTACVKGQDTEARYGGEEFCVILPNTTIHDAATLAETIRLKVGSKKIVNKKTNEDMGRIAVSIGVSKFEYGEPIAQFIKRADEALYTAKNHGRNQVVTQDDVESKKLEFKAGA